MRRKYIVAIFFLALAAVWVALAPFLADGLVVEKPLEKADAILVLSGSAEYVDRTHEAADAFKAGIAPKIVLTNDGHQGGWIESERRNPYFVESAYIELVRQGVPSDAIEILPSIVRGTSDEADLIVSLSAEKKLNSILLVTSAYHSRRALWIFERAITKTSASLIVGVLAPPEGYRYPTRLNWWMSIYGWRSVGSEYVKFAYYWLYY